MTYTSKDDKPDAELVFNLALKNLLTTPPKPHRSTREKQDTAEGDTRAPRTRDAR